MTDYETASLTLQQASVEIGRASVWATYIQAGIAGVVGLIQCALIAWGIWVMKGSNESRAATNQLMIAQSKALTDQSKALADIGAGIREQVELSRAQRAEQSEQSAGIRALLERSQQP